MIVIYANYISHGFEVIGFAESTGTIVIVIGGTGGTLSPVSISGDTRLTAIGAAGLTILNVVRADRESVELASDID